MVELTKQINVTSDSDHILYGVTRLQRASAPNSYFRKCSRVFGSFTLRYTSYQSLCSGFFLAFLEAHVQGSGVLEHDHGSVTVSRDHNHARYIANKGSTSEGIDKVVGREIQSERRLASTLELLTTIPPLRIYFNIWLAWSIICMMHCSLKMPQASAV